MPETQDRAEATMPFGDSKDQHVLSELASWPYYVACDSHW